MFKKNNAEFKKLNYFCTISKGCNLNHIQNAEIIPNEPGQVMLPRDKLKLSLERFGMPTVIVCQK